MNDYQFGNQIYAFRKEAKLSQAELANLLGVTNKAISKWENGNAKPTTEMLKKLSRIFCVSIERLLNMREAQKVKKITKIVITGGPCAGKSTAMTWIQNAFSKLGYAVLFVPETATELITGGVAPWTCSSNFEYQRLQVKLQIEKEKVFMKAAEVLKEEKVLIVCDRGLMDNLAYMTDAEFNSILEEYGTSKVTFRDEYDAIFHLVTAAKGAVEFYTTANNGARIETPEQAIALDDRLLNSWVGHPHLRVIDNSTNFEEKMKRLIAEISSFLGEPEPFEIERKYLIEFPDLKSLESSLNCQKVDIIQTYLKSREGEEIRVRQRGTNGNYVYYQTIKRRVTELKRVEVERRLSQAEYLSLLMEADTSMRQIRKTRYCLTYRNQYFEIDIYPFWRDKAIMEIELKDENEKISFPPEIIVIKEVTDDPSYKNAALAKI